MCVLYAVSPGIYVVIAAEIAAAFIEELEKGRNKSKKHTLNDLIVKKRQTTSEEDKKN